MIASFSNVVKKGFLREDLKISFLEVKISKLWVKIR